MQNLRFKNYLSEKRDDIEGGVEDSKKFLMPSDLDIPVYAMAPPFSLDASNPNNVFMKKLPPKERKVNLLKAVDQFLSIYQFATNNAMIYLVPSRPGLGDLPYVANLGINLPHVNDNTIVIANYKSEPRRGETAVGVRFFEDIGYKTVVAPPFFEGEADLKFINKNNYCGAYGMRTSMNALNWFSVSYDMNIIPVKMDDPELYHLDCVLFPLASDRMFVVTSAVDKATLRKIEKIVDVIPIDNKAGHQGITNSVRMGSLILNGTNIECLKKTDEAYDKEKYKLDMLEKICAQNAYDCVFFPISEFNKSGADLSCMFMHLNYPELQQEPR